MAATPLLWLSLACGAAAMAAPCARRSVRTTAIAKRGFMGRDYFSRQMHGGRNLEKMHAMPIERVQRSFSFWSNVAPIFLAYKIREMQLQKQNPGEGDDDIHYTDVHEWGSEKLLRTIENLQGFYVKSGQIMSTRVDLFPKAYTQKLMALQDSLPPIPPEEARRIIQEDLLDGRPIEEIFSSFDDKPLGAASIAQVHRATLVDGREVAVKVQRPGIERLLSGDLGNLKTFAKALNNVLPVDYFKVFSELEKVVQYELDFLQEAQAARKVYSAVTHTVDGVPTKPSVRVPLPIPGLASRRVLVMEYIEGVPLTQLAKKMNGNMPSDKPAGNGALSRISESVREAAKKTIGVKILEQLTEAYGRMIFGAGFIHGDPHPGNLMVEGIDSNGNLSPNFPKLVLLDCGQFKQLSNDDRKRLARLVMLAGKLTEEIMLAAEDSPLGVRRKQLFREILETGQAMGLELLPGANEETAAAVTLLLFGDPKVPLPGGYSSNELAAGTPLKAIANFPQHLVLLGRATVMIKGLAKRLEVRWPLAEKWKDMAEHAVYSSSSTSLPVWSIIPKTGAQSLPTGTNLPVATTNAEKGHSLAHVLSTFNLSLRLLGLWFLSRLRVGNVALRVASAANAMVQQFRRRLA